MFFTFIIPVYNIEDYLKCCLESVLAAVQPQDEILLALGASRDRSTEIARQYEKKHANIHLIFQDGKGLSNARNCALRVAKGEFLLFVDGDDFVDALALRKLIEDIRTEDYCADVIMTDFFRYYDEAHLTKPIRQIGDRKISGLNSLPTVIEKRQCFWNVWRYVYRRSFLLSNGLYFKENTHGEDIDFITEVFLSSPNIVFWGIPFYCYRMGRRGSLMNETSLPRVRETVEVLKDKIFKLDGEREEWCRTVADRFRFEYILNLALIMELPRSEQWEGETFFCGYLEVLLPTKDWLVKVFAWTIQIIGIKKTASFLLFLKKWKRKHEHRTL